MLYYCAVKVYDASYAMYVSMYRDVDVYFHWPRHMTTFTHSESFTFNHYTITGSLIKPQSQVRSKVQAKCDG